MTSEDRRPVIPAPLPRYAVITHDQADCHQSHVVILPGGAIVASYDDEAQAVEKARWLNRELGIRFETEPLT